MSASPRRSVFVLFVVALPAVVCSAEDWPTYHHDNARQGRSGERLAVPLSPMWSHSAQTAPVPAWPGPDGRVFEGKLLRQRVSFDDAFHVCAAGNRVWFGSSIDHRVICLAADTGALVWSAFTGGPIRLAPTLAEGRLYVGSDDGCAYCFDAADGKLIWKVRAGPGESQLIARGRSINRWPVRTGVMVDGGVAYFGAGVFPSETVYLHAVRADDGKPIWRRDNISESDAGRNDLSPQGYLLTEGSTVFFPSARTLPAAVDRATGEILFKKVFGWRGDAGGVVGGSQAMLADGQIFSFGSDHVLAMNQKTGAVGYGWFAARQMSVAGDAAFVATGTHVARLDRKAYAEYSQAKHKLEMALSKAGTTAPKDEKKTPAGLKKVEDHKKKTEALKKQLKELPEAGFVWKTPTKAVSSLILTADLVFVGGEGSVSAFNQSDGKEVWSARVPGEARGLAVCNGRLLVSTNTGAVLCFGAAKPGVEGTFVETAAKPVAEPFAKDDWTEVYREAADDIVARTGVRRGFCLVVGSEQGRLALELARRGELTILCVEPDADKAAQSQRRLAAAGVYGSRVVVHHGDPSKAPYSNYFANLVVSDTLIRTEKLPADPKTFARHVKPSGGIVCLGRPISAPRSANRTVVPAPWLTDIGLPGKTEDKAGWATLTRGPLPGAGSWTHQYGEAGNTAGSEDKLVNGRLGVLWYGDPGEGVMVNRHEGAVGPLAAGGRLFVQGEDRILAYDSYNGLFLWETPNPGSIRTGVFQNQNPANMVVAGDSLLFMTKDKCHRIDAATGKETAVYPLPPELADGTRQWGYVGSRDGVLVGTATVRGELDKKLKRRGRVTADSTDGVFAIDLATGKPLWTFRGKSVAHHTIALAPGKVCFIDSTITAEQREELLRQDKEDLKQLKGKEAERAEQRLKQIDARTAVTLDLRTGKTLWAVPVDVTDCSEVGIGGGKLTLIYQNDVLLICGANANGHYWKQFLAGDFNRRRLVALSATDGYKLWAKDADYRHRPIIVGDRVIAEPWAFDLATGKQHTRTHPLTGEQVPWSIMREGHHCGMIVGAPNLLAFRSGFTGFIDLSADGGTTHFAGHRTGCWVNAIPADGLVMIPESAAGCVCLFSISATIVLEPKPADAKPNWAIFSSVGKTTPVQRMAINFGAPGDHRDAAGTPWIAYPRPKPSKDTGLDLSLDLKAKLLAGGTYGSLADLPGPLASDPSAWVHASWVRGLAQCTVPLLGKGDAPGVYTVRLHFHDPAPAGDSRFDVKLQGKTVIENLDLAAEAKAGRMAVVREITGVAVADNLLLELVPKIGKPPPAQQPILNGLVVIRTDR